ncbi:LytR/AlgR family response regulator transcription factor [Marinoscillum sp.]|uniref:LytR/AlgR family response regulator transcription factor n=1 Tax=Marinoscillum sp. TaxID=2024838 RepID=UPI003BACE62B
MLTAVIVEDEPHCTERLKRLLQKTSHRVSVTGQFDSVERASKELIQLKPHLVFLDVVLKDGTCFDLLQNISDPEFDIIFTTGHNGYAVEAFEYSAMHYLLKPIDPGHLENAISRCVNNLSAKETSKRLDVLIHNQQAHSSTDSKLVVTVTRGKTVKMLNYKMGEIIRFEGLGNYCTIFLLNGEKYVLSKTLKHYDDLLDGFTRTHQSHLVNKDHIKEYVKTKNGKAVVVLTNGDEIPVSVSQRGNMNGLFGKELL